VVVVAGSVPDRGVPMPVSLQTKISS
jgi:hypothetical protein